MKRATAFVLAVMLVLSPLLDVSYAFLNPDTQQPPTQDTAPEPNTQEPPYVPPVTEPPPPPQSHVDGTGNGDPTGEPPVINENTTTIDVKDNIRIINGAYVRNINRLVKGVPYQPDIGDAKEIGILLKTPRFNYASVYSDDFLSLERIPNPKVPVQDYEYWLGNDILVKEEYITSYLAGEYQGKNTIEYLTSPQYTSAVRQGIHEFQYKFNINNSSLQEIDKAFDTNFLKLNNGSYTYSYDKLDINGTLNRKEFVQMMYKAFKKDTSRFIVFRVDYKHKDTENNKDKYLEVGKTPFLELVGETFAGVNRNKYLVYTLTSRTTPSYYWNKAIEDTILPIGAAESTSDLDISLGEVAVYLLRMLRRNAEPVVTPEEMEMMLVAHGRSIPTYLQRDYIDAVKELMALGIVDEEMDFRDTKAKVNDVLRMLTRAVNKDLRLTFKYVDYPYIRSIVQDGFFPIEIDTTNSVPSIEVLGTTSIRTDKDLDKRTYHIFSTAHQFLDESGLSNLQFKFATAEDKTKTLGVWNNGNKVMASMHFGQALTELEITRTSSAKINQIIDLSSRVKELPELKEYLREYNVSPNQVMYYHIVQGTTNTMLLAGGGTVLKSFTIDGVKWLVPTGFDYSIPQYNVDYVRSGNKNFDYVAPANTEVKPVYLPVAKRGAWLRRTALTNLPGTTTPTQPVPATTEETMKVSEYIKGAKSSITFKVTGYSAYVTWTKEPIDNIAKDLTDTLTKEEQDLGIVLVKEKDTNLFTAYSINGDISKEVTRYIEYTNTASLNETVPAYLSDTGVALIDVNYLKKVGRVKDIIETVPGKQYIIFGVGDMSLVDIKDDIKRYVTGQVVTELSDDDKSPLVIKDDANGTYLVDLRVVSNFVGDLYVIENRANKTKHVVTMSDIGSRYYSQDKANVYDALGNGSIYYKTRSDYSTSSKVPAEWLTLNISDTIPNSNWLIYRRRSHGKYEDFLLNFLPTSIPDRDSESSKKTLKAIESVFGIKLSDNSKVEPQILALNFNSNNVDYGTQVFDSSLKTDITNLEKAKESGQAVKGPNIYYDNTNGKFYYKPHEVTNFDELKNIYLKYSNKEGLNDNSNFASIPIARYGNTFINFNINLPNGELRSSAYDKIPKSMFNSNSQVSNLFSSVQNNSTPATSWIPSPIALYMYYYPELSITWNQAMSSNSQYAYYGTTRGELTKGQVADTVSYALQSNGVKFAFIEADTVSEEKVFTPILFGPISENNRSALLGYRTLLDLELKDPATELALKGEKFSMKLFESILKGFDFDFSNIDAVETIKATDETITKIQIFSITVLPRIMLFFLITFAMLSLIARQPLMQRFAAKVVDPFKLLSFGYTDINQVTVGRAWLSTTLAISFLWMASTTLMQLIGWILGVFQALLNM